MHGGKRPGAGAPRGNINALKHAQRSTRYADAHSLLSLLDKLLPVPRPDDPAERRRLKQQQLDAAIWVVQVPMVRNMVDEQVRVYAASPLCKAPRGHLIHYMLLEQKATVTWQILTGAVLYLHKWDPTFGLPLAEELDKWLDIALNRENFSSTSSNTPHKQSNNQDFVSGDPDDEDN